MDKKVLELLENFDKKYTEEELKVDIVFGEANGYLMALLDLAESQGVKNKISEKGIEICLTGLINL